MQFEEFDKKAKEAADHHHPAYDEQAWAKMEKLLDKHLPQKEDNRRRFILFWLVFLGLAFTGLFIANPWKKESSVSSIEPQKKVLKKHPLTATSPTETDKEDIKTDNALQSNDDQVSNTVKLENNNQLPDFSDLKEPLVLKENNDNSLDRKITTHILTSQTSKIKKDQPVAKPGNDFGQNKIAVNEPDADVKPIKKGDNIIAITDKKKEEEIIGMTPTVVNAGNPVNNEPAVIAEAKKDYRPVAQNKTKVKAKKRNSFFFTISTGPDVSFVNTNKLGTTKLVAGAGLGYTFNNRFTLSTGFYSARKIYTASPDAYHPPANFYAYYPYLENVAADCKVYEIPLSLSYNFSHTAKQSWFATAGLSSYLMKKETYNYSYKYTLSGPVYNRKRTLENENKHFFSGLTLSAGYRRSIGKHISIMAEPYIKLPLTGVGYGKVKLNSGGVLFSIGVNPFNAKK